MIIMAKNDTLNQAIWDENNELKPEVKEKLEQIAQIFIDKLAEDDIPLDVDDIIIVGSNANYNYGPQSDIDLHIVADLSQFKGREKELAEKIYQAKKTIFNDKYDPMIRGFQVEIYVEPAEDKNMNKIPDEVEMEEEQLEEDTIKQNGKWVNKGKEGTHGSFKTKKAADAQRKAMFANGYHESLEEEYDYEDLEDYVRHYMGDDEISLPEIWDSVFDDTQDEDLANDVVDMIEKYREDNYEDDESLNEASYIGEVSKEELSQVCRELYRRLKNTTTLRQFRQKLKASYGIDATEEEIKMALGMNESLNEAQKKNYRVELYYYDNNKPDDVIYFENMKVAYNFCNNKISDNITYDDSLTGILVFNEAKDKLLNTWQNGGRGWENKLKELTKMNESLNESNGKNIYKVTYTSDATGKTLSVKYEAEHDYDAYDMAINAGIPSYNIKSVKLVKNKNESLDESVIQDWKDFWKSKGFDDPDDFWDTVPDDISDEEFDKIRDNNEREFQDWRQKMWDEADRKSWEEFNKKYYSEPEEVPEFWEWIELQGMNIDEVEENPDLEDYYRKKYEEEYGDQFYECFVEFPVEEALDSIRN